MRERADRAARGARPRLIALSSTGRPLLESADVNSPEMNILTRSAVPHRQSAGVFPSRHRCRGRLSPDPAGGVSTGDAGVAYFADDPLWCPKPRIDLLVRRDVPRQAATLNSGSPAPDRRNTSYKLRREPRVELMGFLNDAELARAYAGARAVLFVPYQEDYGFITASGDAQRRHHRSPRATRSPASWSRPSPRARDRAEARFARTRYHAAGPPAVAGLVARSKRAIPRPRDRWSTRDVSNPRRTQLDKILGDPKAMRSSSRAASDGVLERRSEVDRRALASAGARLFVRVVEHPSHLTGRVLQVRFGPLSVAGQYTSIRS